MASLIAIFGEIPEPRHDPVASQLGEGGASRAAGSMVEIPSTGDGVQKHVFTRSFHQLLGFPPRSTPRADRRKGLNLPTSVTYGHGSGVATAAHAVPNRRERPTGTQQRAKPGFQVVRVAQSRYGAVRRYGQGGITGRSPPICPGMTWRLADLRG